MREKTDSVEFKRVVNFFNLDAEVLRYKLTKADLRTAVAAMTGLPRIKIKQLMHGLNYNPKEKE